MLHNGLENNKNYNELLPHTQSSFAVQSQTLASSLVQSDLLELQSNFRDDHLTLSFFAQVLLLDLPPPTLPPQEKLLIDLTNTPDFIRTNNKTCSAAQVTFTSSGDNTQALLESISLFKFVHIPIKNYWDILIGILRE